MVSNQPSLVTQYLLVPKPVLRSTNPSPSVGAIVSFPQTVTTILRTALLYSVSEPTLKDKVFLIASEASNFSSANELIPMKLEVYGNLKW